MTGIVASTDLFALRCNQAAGLVAAGKLSLIDAADQLQRLAQRSGVIDRLGQDRVQRVMAASLKQIRRVP
jgi:hypothetical protein